MTDSKRVQESLGSRPTDLENEMTSSVIVDSRQSQQKVEFSVGHLDSCHENGSISFGHVIFVTGDQIVDQGLTKCIGVYSGLLGRYLVIVLSLKNLGSKENDVWWKSPVAILGEDRLGDVPLVLFVEALPMFDSGEGPLINVELKILKDPSGLASLPLRGVKQGLALAGLRVLAVHPR